MTWRLWVSVLVTFASSASVLLLPRPAGGLAHMNPQCTLLVESWCSVSMIIWTVWDESTHLFFFLLSAPEQTSALCTTSEYILPLVVPHPAMTSLSARCFSLKPCQVKSSWWVEESIGLEVTHGCVRRFYIMKLSYKYKLIFSVCIHFMPIFKMAHGEFNTRQETFRVANFTTLF